MSPAPTALERVTIKLDHEIDDIKKGIKSMEVMIANNSSQSEAIAIDIVAAEREIEDLEHAKTVLQRNKPKKKGA